MDNFKIVADKDLKTKEDIEDRIQSIHRQIAKTEEVFNPRDFNKHHLKIIKFVKRYETLESKLWKMKREVCI